MTTLSLVNKDVSIAALWELDVLGIPDPIEKRSKEETEAKGRECFIQSLTMSRDGRYEVELPWKEGHPPLPSNLSLVEKRLEIVIAKLKRDHIYAEYNQVFQEWLDEGII